MFGLSWKKVVLNLYMESKMLMRITSKITY